eukprot:TRINITY_DN11223_c0_g1_i1.p1 TRINITY_DN11223_c0_g1~~TRINITY_DN11223_c0_g1_i1.p1  ORF type:complete len:233 (-),score=54.92 TRINITY_DN11223_c0_g1_i1:75-773(-)
MLSIEDLEAEIELIKQEIKQFEKKLAAPKPEDYTGIFEVPPYCIPINADVRDFKFEKLGADTQFDAIVMDPPWQLAGKAPSRGVAIGYKQLKNEDIQNMAIPKLQTNGFLFIWVINARYAFALNLFDQWGYRLVDDIAWVKSTVNRRLAKGHGFYLQHAKETCLVGLKGKPPKNMRGNFASDVIFSQRRGQSQKPQELYELIETLVPDGKYLEIFARRNNLRNFWVSIGNEL